MAWLHQQGFEAPFLDFDKHSGIPPGADWERTLYRELEHSEAVIIVQTPNWLDSKWCFAEFTQARALGKAIFPVIEAPTGDTLISPDIQALDLLHDREGGLKRLASQLTQIALNAQGGFAWDANRPPYPGLLAFQEEDAAVYFGRDDDIRRLIERLNARRAQGGAKLIALLGASGSGKSSLLRAGVIPRIKRDTRNWIVVPPMRPQARPVDELARTLTIATGRDPDWCRLLDDLNGDNLASALDDVANHLRIKAEANEAQILLPIDQAEELFGAADLNQARRFLQIVTAAMASDQPFIAVMALRSDFLVSLQSTEHLTARFEEFSLGPMPLARIPQIIKGPARVAGLGIDEALVHQAARDAQTEDALPLLAFALRELYDRASGDNFLSLDEYQALGDVKEALTPLENAVRRAADQVLAEAKPTDEELTALREAFVPAMVRVNEQGDYVRRPARWDVLPAKSHVLLERLARARLLILRQDGDARMVEVAHEALLRKWPSLRSWLDDAREFLTGKQQLERDVNDWENTPEADKTGALLTGLKLNRARGWLAERPHQLTSRERGLIQASINHEEAEERRKARLRRNITTASIAAALTLACVAVFAGLQWLEAKRAANDLVQAARERAVELTRYAWMDLGTKQEQVSRLSSVEKMLNIQAPGPAAEGLELAELQGDWAKFFPGGARGVDHAEGGWRELQEELFRLREDLLPHTICPSYACLETKVQPDGFNCQTWLNSGFRHLYCSVRSVIDFKKAQSIAGIKIFSSGPHGDELNLSDVHQFGHYNPTFLDWLDEYIIPQGMDDVRFNQITRLVYSTHIGPIARALYHSHEILFADAEAQRAFERRYQVVKMDYLQRTGAEYVRFQQDPKEFASIRSDYEARVEKGSEAGWSLGEDFRWLSDYLATDKNDDWYLANTAGGFWVRRSIDGTEAQIFHLLEKLLKTFEPSIVASP